MNPKSIPPVYVLLVDDLSENLLALEALLRRDGLVVLKANSGPQALELLLNYDVALALIDVQMPIMDGFELAELMRGTERTRRVPIIFLTAGTADWQRRFQGYGAGAVDFLHKPIEPDILRSKADVFFELYRQRQEVAIQRDELKIATQENARLLKESMQYAEALKVADRRKDEFLAMLAHELRNPLAPIQNAVEILRISESVDPTVINAREIIARQISHMGRLINDLLDVARITRGQIELQTESHDLVSIVRQTAEDYRPSFSAAGLNLILELPNEPIVISGDLTRLAQVVGNLLHNAEKFTPIGGNVTASVANNKSNNFAIVSIKDDGAGLESVVKLQLFEAFTQANQALARTKGGLGLGLAIAKGLIESHGGSIAVDSPGLNMGSTFTIKLPTIGTFVDHKDQPSPPTLQETKKARILVVEDNHDTAKTQKLLLTLLGYEVEVAHDADQGLALIHSFKPNIVMSDLGLPGELDGFAFAKKIRADNTLSNIHLVALSGYGQEEDIRKSKDAGFNQHLIKPVQLDLLKQTLVSAIKDCIS